jgi:8-oxo-dGTP pyrophosphatase MutT (NUDIX family)
MDRQTSPPRVEVRAIVRRPPGRYLIVSASSDSAAPWDFPGDGVHPSQTPEDALRQVLRVQLGIDHAELIPQSPFSYGTGTRATLYRYFLARVRDDTAVPLEVARLRWVAAPQLAEHAFVPPAALMVERIQASEAGVH